MDLHLANPNLKNPEFYVPGLPADWVTAHYGIPADEVATMVEKRCALPRSFATKMVGVMQILQRSRKKVRSQRRPGGLRRLASGAIWGGQE